MPIRLRFAELVRATFGLSTVEVPDTAIPIVEEIARIDFVRTLRNDWHDEVGRMLARIFHGSGNFRVPASIGENSWSNLENESSFYSENDTRLPPFNDFGIKSIAGVLSERIVRNPDDPVFAEPTSLILGGSRISKSFMTPLTSESGGLPFFFQSREDFGVEVEEPNQDDVERLRRGFVKTEAHSLFDRKGDVDRSRLYYKDFKVGRYVADRAHPERGSLGPVADKSGIRSDVLILSVLPNGHGSHAVILNAAYGAASRVAQVLCNGNQLAPIASAAAQMGEWDALQILFSVPQISEQIVRIGENAEEARIAVESYGTPRVEKGDIRLVKNWARTPAGGKLVGLLREELRHP